MEEGAPVQMRTVEHSMPLDVLCDLISRFIINVPESAKENLIRICFQIELAYWYYLDFYVNGDNKLQGCAFRDFAAHVFQHLPYLQIHISRLPEILEEWKEYKMSVPTYGAILMNEDNTHVLLVQSYWAKTSWGFPKGKVNEDEDPAHCAVREVYEETGFNISSYLDPNSFLESVINEQHVRLYLISGIPKDTKFQPRTRYEIKACEWFAIADLPNSKKDTSMKTKTGMNPNSFFMVLPFVKRLKSIAQNGIIPKARRPRTKSCSSFSESEATPSVQKNKYSRQHSQTDEYKKEERKPFNGKAPCSKRQLFAETSELIFTAPSWLNFKFDRAAIMESIQ